MRVAPLLFLIACTPPPGWSTAPALFPERQNHAVVTNGTFAYAVGGLSASGAALDLLTLYNPANGVWASLAKLPLALHHPNACVLGDNLFILGGFTDAEASSACFRYAFSTNTWSDCAPGSERGAAACAVVNDRVYLFGGVRADTAVADAHEYDPTTNTWRELPPLPTARSHMGAVVFGGRVHVIGGRTHGLVPTGRVDIFDPLTGTWSEGPNMIVARSDYAMSTDGAQALIFGGEGNSADPLGMFAAVERYDGVGFSRLADMPHARHGTGAVYIVTSGIGAIFLPGGAEIAGFAPTSYHDVLTQ